jgi:DNA-binding transcriptional MerR regulator
MDIGVVSKKSGVSTSALRYYEEIGLIVSTDRKGLRRQYSASVLETLALISLAKQAGFELQELSQLFKKQKDVISIDRGKLKAKSIEIERRIEQLEAARKGLIHASQCRAPNHLECPKFLRLLALATKKQMKKRRVSSPKPYKKLIV